MALAALIDMKTFGLLLLLAIPWGSASAADSAIRARWEQLDSLILSHKIRFLFPDGKSARARVIAVTDSEIQAEVYRSSDRKAHPLGVVSLPRGSVAELKILKSGGKWTTVGAVAGSVGGLAAGGWAASHRESATAFWSAWIATAVIGTAIGAVADHNDVRVVIDYD